MCEQSRVTEVPKISRQDVEVVKNTRQERISERSQVIEVPKISREDVEIVKSTPQERISERRQVIEVPEVPKNLMPRKCGGRRPESLSRFVGRIREKRKVEKEKNPLFFFFTV